jgi:hypothetical protein
VGEGADNRADDKAGTSGRSASKAGGEGFGVDCDEKASGSNVDLSLAVARVTEGLFGLIT